MFKKMQVGVLIFVFMLAAVAAAGAAGEFVEDDVTILHTLTGDNGFYFGWVASGLGDISGDGVPDFITSDISFNGFAGKIYVYSGSDGSLLNSHAGESGSGLGYGATLAGDVNGDGTADYIAGAPWGDRVLVFSGADHSILYDLSGTGGSSFGASVAGAGDVNGDGYGDFLIGSDTYGADGNGRVDLYSGADGALLRSHVGPAGGSMGTALGKIGDIDGDNVPDYVVGARSAGQQGRGLAYAYSGASGAELFTMSPVGLPGDGFPAFALFFASGAGDVNGDGTPDIYVGDYNAKHGNVNTTGRAYVFSGRDGQRIRVLNAADKGEGFGPGRGVGDVNGDGHGDLIVGAYQNSDGGELAGKAYLISGKNGRTLRTMTGAIDGLQLGVDALPVGDLNGDGALDYALTGFGILYVVAGTP